MNKEIEKCRSCGIEIKFGAIHEFYCQYRNSSYPILCGCGIVLYPDSPKHKCLISIPFHFGPKGETK